MSPFCTSLLLILLPATVSLAGAQLDLICHYSVWPLAFPSAPFSEHGFTAYPIFQVDFSQWTLLSLFLVPQSPTVLLFWTSNPHSLPTPYTINTLLFPTLNAVHFNSNLSNPGIPKHRWTNWIFVGFELGFMSLTKPWSHCKIVKVEPLLHGGGNCSLLSSICDHSSVRGWTQIASQVPIFSVPAPSLELARDTRYPHELIREVRETQLIWRVSGEFLYVDLILLFSINLYRSSEVLCT